MLNQSIKTLDNQENISAVPFNALLLYLIFLFLNPLMFLPFLSSSRIVLVISIFALGSAIIFNKESFPKSSINRLSILFLLSLLISIFFSFDIDRSLERLGFIIKCFSLYLLLVLVMNNGDNLIKVNNVVTILVSIISVVTLVTKKMGISEAWRMNSYFEGIGSSSNGFAMLLIVFLPFYIHKIEHAKSKIKIGLLLIGLTASALCIMQTRSRMGFYAVALYALILLIRHYKNIKVLMLVGLVGVFIVSHTHEHTWQRSMTLKHEITREVGKDSPNRKNKFRQAIVLIQKHPIVGVGLANFMNGVRRHNLGESEHTVHNSYLEIASESGILASILFSLIVFFTYRYSVLSKTQFSTQTEAQELEIISKSNAEAIMLAAFCLIFLSEYMNRILYILFANATVLYNKADLSNPSSQKRAV